MAQPLLNVLEGNAVGQQQAGTSVRQIVKAHPAQAVALQKLRKRVCQVVHPHPLPQLVHEYKAVVFIVVAVAADPLVQLLHIFQMQKVFPETADQRQGTQTGLGLAVCCSISVCLPSRVTVRMTEIVPRSKSMASHFSPNTSPRRNP